MRFKNYHIPGLFDDFSDADELELGASIGNMTYEEACKHRIPTKEEIHYLIAIGVLKEGMSSFWSASVVSDDVLCAWTFHGYCGIIAAGTKSYGYDVRCVSGGYLKK